MIKTIEWKNNNLSLIDQRLLPGKLKYIMCKNKKEVFDAIKKLKVRGAPAIGVAGAFGVYIGIGKSKASSFDKFFKELNAVGKYIGSSRPTARNLFWAIERMTDIAVKNQDKPVTKIKEILLKEAKLVLSEDKKICREIGKNGAKIIVNGDTLLTHCNAGALATADFGTALAPMYIAKSQKKKFKVFVDETRPVLQGSRLTSWELQKNGIDVTLICDNMAASLMAKKLITKVIVGADRISANADVANKIGTYNVAVLCKYHRVPFYVAAPISTFDANTKTGKDINIEQRDADEVRKLYKEYIAPKDIKVFNPAFDVTPASLVTGYITEKGILTSKQVIEFLK